MKPSIENDPETFRAGFSLTEVSLALLVIAVGMLSVVGLFPAGLDMSKRAIDETYAAFFADSTFASFREAALHVPWDELENYLAIGPVTVEDNEDVFWKDSEELRVIGDGQVYTNVYSAASNERKWLSGFPLPESWEAEDHAFKFSFLLTNEPTASGLEPMVKRAILKIWLDRYANEAKVEPMTFYSEIYRHKRVP